ncbi:hypothetical protein L1049_022697 [Liquidambar formosana]|uniref:C2H2-type domain-containing protein n=1 Tax=Liquidambar formosana TaxID=63359 RepID=A0AAP0RE90_LIQFO
MERHKCKLCSRSFANGRALGGHMRSHLATLPIPPKIHQLSDRTDSASFSSSSSSEEENRAEKEVEKEEEEEEEEEEKGLVYGLRENPKRSFKLADPEFSFTVDAGSIVQDRESETESRNPTRKRSKRNRKVGITVEFNQMMNLEKRPKLKRPSSAESQTEPEPVSSVSDTSPEEDVAMCLMMLSRDKWMGKEIEEDESDGEKYKCETCRKVFPTYQALGGHRASHKKTRSCFQDESESRNAANIAVIGSKKKIHECPFCYKVFGSGQALGGHKRSHLLVSSTTTTIAAAAAVAAATNIGKFGESLIDLNLPAPMEDEAVSQLEGSAVSDAEFINPIKS